MKSHLSCNKYIYMYILYLSHFIIIHNSSYTILAHILCNNLILTLPYIIPLSYLFYLTVIIVLHSAVSLSLLLLSYSTSTYLLIITYFFHSYHIPGSQFCRLIQPYKIPQSLQYTPLKKMTGKIIIIS